MKSSTPPPLQPQNIAVGRSPLYMEAARLIKQQIKQGHYPIGSTLPSIRQLSKALDLSHNAVQRAIQQLETEQIVESQHGVGIKVLAEKDCAYTAHWIALVQPYHSLASVTLQRGIEQAMEDRSNFCIVKTTDNDPERERQVIDHLISNGINGLLLWPVDNDQNDAYLQDVIKQIPTVLVDREIASLQVPAVVHDYRTVGLDIVDFLHNKGCRKILVICDPVSISTFEELKQSIVESCKKHGIDKQLRLIDDPVMQLIDDCQQGDFRLALKCFENLKPILTSGDYDAVICPQGQYVQYVLAATNLLKDLAHIPIVSFRNTKTARDNYNMLCPNMIHWTMNQLSLFHEAIRQLDEQIIKGNRRKRVTRIPIKRDLWVRPV